MDTLLILNNISTKETYADRKIDERKLVFSKLKSFQNEIEELEDTLEIGQQKLQQYFGLPLVIITFSNLEKSIKYW
jgi:hypothetical protein